MKNIIFAVVFAMLAAVVDIADADDFTSQLKAYLDGATWIQDPIVVVAVQNQNDAHASLSQDDIDTLDKQWRAE